MSSLGWQKIDVSTTVRQWYADGGKSRLRFLVDCSGCANHINIQLFNDGPAKSNRKSKDKGKFLLTLMPMSLFSY